MILFGLNILARTKSKRSEVMRIGASVVHPTRLQPGCERCDFYQDVADKETLFFVEEWNTQADLKQHILSPEFRRVLAMMDLSDDSPKVTFYIGGTVRGMEFVEETLSENP